MTIINHNSSGQADLVSVHDYKLDHQVGFLLRQANQRHTAIFAKHIPDRTTPTQFAAMVRLLDEGPLSQNLLGRRIALDAATIKGVVGRLVDRDLVEVNPDPDDGRRFLVSLTHHGRNFTRRCIQQAERISQETLSRLDRDEATQLIELLETLSHADT